VVVLISIILDVSLNCQRRPEEPVYNDDDAHNPDITNRSLEEQQRTADLK
jgi:hypothetical protein